jgi:hypothetical protein
MILRIERDGIEFFVNTKTGKTGISISGLARLCGVSPQALWSLLQRLEELIANRQKSVSTKNASKSPKGNPSKAKTVSTKNQKSVVHKNASESLKDNPSKAKTVVHKNQSDSTEEKSRRGRPSLNEEDLPESLLALLEEEIYLAVGLEYKNVKVIAESAIGKFVEYYAMDAQETKPEAKNVLRKFNRRGVRGWIYDIVEWQPTSEPPPPLTRAEELGIEPRYIQAKFDRHIIYNDLLDRQLTAPMYRVFLYFTDCNLINKQSTPEEVSKYAQVAKHSLYDLIERMRPLGLVPDWFEIDATLRAPEAQIRDRLHQELGGEIEVQTIYGPIDLLTPTDLIEIKKIEDWKEGFGQVMAKCKSFPQHQKRLHLFGTNDRALRNIKACCKEFEISVSYEECNALAA